MSTSTLPHLGEALGETSAVVYPRIHFVWDAIWCFLTESDETESKKSKKRTSSSSMRHLRERTPLAEESSLRVVETIMNVVVKERLLRLNKESSAGKATHDRKSLALCIIKNLSGTPFISSLSGPTQILASGEAMESVILAPEILENLFVKVITAGSGNRPQDSPHMLKPLALETLRAIVDASAEAGGSHQLSCVKALLNCSTRFDSRTKTSTVSDLLMFSSERSPTEEDFSLWNEYLEYLETTFLELCRSQDDADISSQANGYVEVLYSAAKNILHTGTSNKLDLDTKVVEYKENVVKRILDFFMVVAFFDPSNATKPAESKKSKKKKQKSVVNSVLESAVKVKESTGSGNEIPYTIRAIVSSRFFSLAADFSMVMSHSSKDDENEIIQKDSNTLKVLVDIGNSWRDLESNGAKRFGVAKVEPDDEEDNCDPQSIVEDLRKHAITLAKTANADPDNSLKECQKRCSTGIAVLAYTLYLHRLNCGTDGSMDEDPDADEENDEEEICNALEGLKAVAEDFMSTNELESNPLLGLAESCANILASPLGSGNIGRAASPKLVRESVKYAWLGGLKLAASMSTEEKTLLDSSVIDLLMEAIGASENEEGDDNGAMDEDSEEGDSEGSEDEEENSDADDRVFSKASNLLDEPEDMQTEPTGSAPDDGSESDVEIDHSKLQAMLEEDSDADVDEDVLEHHEGADAALAKLIKLKQDARKAGQLVQERIEVSNQLRCTLLLELLLGRPDPWNRLFRSNVLEMVLPLLKHRKKVATTTQKAIESGTKIGTGEKKALLDRLTNLIKQKLCKLRLSSMPFQSPINLDSSSKLLKLLTIEAKKAKDKEQVSCCSSCIIFVLRSMPNSPEVVAMVSSEYDGIIKEWATKRGRGASLFEDLINHTPLMAQATLLESLATAARDARSPFLKVEAFRMLSLLFSGSSEKDASGMNELAQKSISDSQQSILEAMNMALDDEEMSKPKRVRTVLKALEKFLPFMEAPAPAETIAYLEDIRTKTEKLGGDGPLAAVSSKLSGLMGDSFLKELQSNETKEKKTESSVDKDADDQPASGGKKSKKKKKKKNKR